MEVERQKEETKSEEQDLVTSHHPLLPHKPYTWLMITEGENDSERLILYSVEEDSCYVKFVPELKNKHVACCHGELLVLRDKSTNACSILDILTMKKKELPPLNSYYELNAACVLSSPKMDSSCRVIFFERKLMRFMSCHIDDSEFIEHELMYKDECINNLINFKGKLYAVTNPNLFLVVSDFWDPGLSHEVAVRGESLKERIFAGRELHTYLVESCEDLLLIVMGSYAHEVSDIKIFKADLKDKKWVELETLGDRAIFLGSRSNSFSSPATAIGMKGNAVYWVKTPSRWHPPERHLYKYDIEDKSISLSLLLTNIGSCSSLTWVPQPMNCDWEKKPNKREHEIAN